MFTEQSLRFLKVITDSLQIIGSCLSNLAGRQISERKRYRRYPKDKKNLFQPIIKTIGRAVKSNTGKAIGKAIKEHVIESGTNLATDVLRGNNLSEGLNREVNTFKERGAVGIEQLQKK